MPPLRCVALRTSLFQLSSSPCCKFAQIQRKDLNLVRSDLAVVLRAGQAVATAVSYTIKQPNGHQRISVHSLSDQLPSIRSSNCLDRNGSHHSPWLDTVGLICPFCHEFDLPPKFVTLSLGFSLKCLGLLLACLIFRASLVFCRQRRVRFSGSLFLLCQ